MAQWEIRHLRTRLMLLHDPHWRAHWFEWAWPADTPDLRTTRLHGHHFEIVCPEHDQEVADSLLTDLDVWAERIGLDSQRPGRRPPALLGLPFWTDVEVALMVQRHVDLWPSARTLRLPAEPAPGCRSHELPVSGSADRAAARALVMSDLVVAFAPGMTWADINRDFCRYLHRDRDKLPHAR